jgi:hypothetical protein
MHFLLSLIDIFRLIGRMEFLGELYIYTLAMLVENIRFTSIQGVQLLSKSSESN